MLKDETVDLWLTYYDQIDSDDLEASYHLLLCEKEALQLRRFRFENDRRCFLVTRALARIVLSRYLQIKPEELLFSANEFGRPIILNREAREHGINFNIAHARSLIVLGVTKNRMIGVDVERIEERNITTDIANLICTPDEIHALAALSPSHQQHRLLEYWTFKESYAKARGVGLSISFESFGFHFPDERRVEILFHECSVEKSNRWQFWQLRSSQEHLIAVCAERIAGQNAKIAVKETIPGMSEKLLSVEPVRVS
jgi:4'-phosphopantetheinyl transferase